MQFPNLKAGIGRLLSEHASTLLTAGGVVGVVGTAVLTGRASFQSAKALTEQEDQWNKDAARYDVENDGHGRLDPLTKTDKVKTTWPYFVPPVVCGSLTIASIVMSNRVSAKEAAALAAAYGITQNQLEEYRAKVLEKLGVNKEQKIRDEIAQDGVNENPPKGQVLLLGEGLVLCKDSLSGRYFQSTVERIRKAENAVNAQLFHHQICSLNFFYEEVGLETTDLGDGLGWNMVTADSKQLTINFTTTMTDAERPCIVLDFNILPKHNYEQLY